METPSATIDALVQRVEQYGKTSFELYKLKAIDKASDAVSSAAVFSTLLIFILFFMVVVSIGVAILVGDRMGEMYLGFFVVAGFYALTTLILFIFRNKWIRG